MEWSTQVPAVPGWYAIHYIIRDTMEDARPMIDFFDEEDLEDYRDAAKSIDDDLKIWFYGPVKIDVPELELTPSV